MHVRPIIGIFFIFLFCIVNVTAFSNDGGGTWTGNLEINVKENSGSFLTNYPIAIELDSDIFDFTQAQPNGEDIRFSDDTSTTEFSYWIERYKSTSPQSAKIWIKIPAISPNHMKKIKMHFGNAQATSSSNGDATFTWFDQFDTDTKDDYISTSMDPRSSDENIAQAFSWKSDTQEMMFSKVPYDWYGLLTNGLPSDNYAIKAKMRTTSLSDYRSYFGVFLEYTDKINGEYVYLYPNCPWANQIMLNESSIGDFYLSDAIYPSHLDSVYSFEAQKTPNMVSIVINDQSISQFDTYFPGQIRPGLFSGNNGPVYFDDFIVRTYTAPEPTIGFSSASISITSPTGGESWQQGTLQKIEWTYTGNPGTDVKIELYKGGSLNSVIKDSTSIGDGGNGLFYWKIPTDLIPASDYKIKVTSTSNPSISDICDSIFIIFEPTTITITTPNGGESWQQGSKQKIMWSFTGDPDEFIKIELWKGGINGIPATISPSTRIGDGYFDWTIPKTMVDGSDYQIKITSTSNPSISDMSDDVFTIFEPTTITITTPSGGESWPLGSDQTIQWTYSGDPGSFVMIKLWRWESYTLLTGSTPIGSSGSGSFPWKVPTTLETGDYHIEITSTSDSEIYDWSESFAITQQQTGITGYVKFLKNNQDYPVLGIPVYLYKKGNNNPIDFISTDKNGKYAFDINYGTNEEFYVMAKWEDENVTIYNKHNSFFDLEAKEIANRFPLDGYIQVPPKNMWPDIIFNADEDAAVYLKAKSLYDGITKAHDYVQKEYGTKAGKINAYIESYQMSFQDFPNWEKDGAIYFKTTDFANYYENSIWHEYGHALRSQAQPGIRTAPFEEGWATYFAEKSGKKDISYPNLEENHNIGDFQHDANNDDHRWGVVYAGIFRDIDDGSSSSDFDFFDGTQNDIAGFNGNQRIWFYLMKQKATNINNFYTLFTNTALSEDKQALNQIYATHGVIAPSYKGRINPGTDHHLQKIQRGSKILYDDYSITNTGIYPLNYEIHQHIVNLENNKIPKYDYNNKIKGDGLRNINPQQTSDSISWDLDAIFEPGVYSIITDLVPSDYNGEFCSGTSCEFIDNTIYRIAEYVIITSEEPSNEKPLSITTNCPIDLKVINPDGLIIDKTQNQIPDAQYTEIDVDTDGSPDDSILIPQRKVGIYQIFVIPEAGAEETDTYSLRVSSGAVTKTLADKLVIKDLPKQPYKIEVTSDGQLIVKDGSEIPTPEFPSIFLPATLIVGFLGAVFLIQRTREN